jgi:hypothetical protein
MTGAIIGGAITIAVVTVCLDRILRRPPIVIGAAAAIVAATVATGSLNVAIFGTAVAGIGIGLLDAVLPTPPSPPDVPASHGGSI